MIVAYAGETSPDSLYKNGTSSPAFFAFLWLPYRALQCDRCLVITTFCNLFAPFHGADAGSNPAGGRQINRLGEKLLLSV